MSILKNTSFPPKSVQLAENKKEEENKIDIPQSGTLFPLGLNRSRAPLQLPLHQRPLQPCTQDRMLLAPELW
jgi:hypothetical protein